MNSNDAISFYVPARNATDTLTRCATAVQSQTRPPDEFFIIVDPRSTDDTLEVAKQCGVPVIQQKGDTLGTTRNEALAHARHRWVASCDSDVVIKTDWLEKLASSRDTGATGIGGRTQERICSVCDAWRALHMPHHWGEHPFHNPFMLVSEVLFDRQALSAIGGYRDDLNYYEDSDLCQRLRDAGYNLYYQPAAVATHLRRDDLLSLLDLRWKYSEYRQKQLMGHYDGLVAKLDVNREYAINTLSKSLSRHREELAYISFLLYFHHILRDYRSLISEATHHFNEVQLLNAIVQTTSEHDTSLAEDIERDLSPCVRRSDIGQTDQPVTPGWESYIERVRSHIAASISELPGEVRDVIATSARVVHEDINADEVLRLAPNESLADQVDRAPLTTFVDRAFIQSIRQQWLDAGHIHVLGALTDRERKTVDKLEPQQGKVAVALLAHLESHPHPLAAFDEVAATAPYLVACYRPPARFIPGLDIPSASDLASAAVAAGWHIERFDTLIGRTRLMLSRKPKH